VPRLEINKLKSINERLTEQLAQAKKNLESSIVKLKSKKALINNSTDQEDKTKDKEMQALLGQIKEAQNVIKTLREQIESNPAIEKGRINPRSLS
jgi:hypothetical protein